MKYFICFFIILFQGLCFAQSADSLHWRFFPELKDHRIYQLSKISSKHVLALTGTGSLLEWKGNSWKEFEPQPPQYASGNLIALAPDNIWRFYLEHPSVYCTKCLHFDGKAWKKVPLTQPYYLGMFDFIDSSRFWGAGGWGSLIYYDGKTSHNVRIPVNDGVSWIKAFSEDSAVVLMNTSEKPKAMDLYEYAKGNWKMLLHWDKQLTMAHFFSPDSFIFVSENSFLFKYAAGSFQVLDTLEDAFLNYHNISKDCIYYFSDNWIWRYKYPQNEKIVKTESPSRILLLQKNSYFIVRKDQSLMYYGDKEYGTPFIENKSGFVKLPMLYSENSRHLGLAAYKNTQSNTEIYFTSPEHENLFINIFGKRDDYNLNFRNVIAERNLTGYVLAREKETVLWDGSTVFADLDNDRDMDAVLTSLRGCTKLFENIGNDLFENVTELYDFKLLGRIQDVSVSDFNNDGWLDIMAGEETGPLHVFLNRGYWRFEDITYQVGFQDTLTGYKTALADMNNDGFPDLFLFGNYDRVRYFENAGQRGMPRFIEKSALSPELTTRLDFFTSSIAFADFDIDGDVDFLLVNRRSPLKLFENIGGAHFKDVSADMGFNQSFLCYGAAWGDLDMDGWRDIFLTTLGKNYIFWNREGRSFDIDSLSIPDNKLEYSTACLTEDLDNNGVLDVVVANYEIGASYFLYNLIKDPSYINIKLNALMNTSAIGAHVELYESGFTGNKEYLKGYQEIRNQNGYCSGTLPQACFFIDSTKSYEARIRFPSGKIIERKNLTAHNSYVFQEPASVNEKLSFQLSALGSGIFNLRYRKIVIQFLIILITFILVNYFIYKYTIWHKYHLLFYDAFLAVIYSALSFYFLQFALWSRFLIPVYVSVVLGVFLFWLINRYIKLQYQEEREFELFDLMRQFHHSHVGMNTIDHLIFYVNNFNDTNLIKEFGREVDYYRRNTYPLLKRISFLGLKLLKQRKTVNRFKRNHSSIFRRLNSGKDIRNPSALRNNLTELKEDISAIRGAVDGLFTSNLVGCVSEALQNFTQFSNVSLINKTGLAEVFIVIKHGALIQVLDNILQNAIESMSNKKEKNLDIILKRADSEHIRVIIRDYGEGIKNKNRSRIFEENFSTKNSSGIGLFHVKQLVARYGAKIDLSDALPQSGASFELTFRLRR